MTCGGVTTQCRYRRAGPPAAIVALDAFHLLPCVVVRSCMRHYVRSGVTLPSLGYRRRVWRRGAASARRWRHSTKTAR